LFYKQFGNQEAAMEQFRWILKGPRPISRGGLIPRRDSSSLSLASLASRASTDSNSSSYVHNNPDKFKKYEFAKVLKHRCTVATDQIRTNAIQPTSIFNNSKVEQTQIPNLPYHNRKKSSSSLLKEIQEQSLLQKQSSTETFVKRHKPRSMSLPYQDTGEESKNNNGESTKGSNGNKVGLKNRIFGKLSK